MLRNQPTNYAVCIKNNELMQDKAILNIIFKKTICHIVATSTGIITLCEGKLFLKKDYLYQKLNLNHIPTMVERFGKYRHKNFEYMRKLIVTLLAVVVF